MNSSKSRLESTEALCGQGEKSLEAGHPDRAEIWFNRALQVDPDCLQAHEGIARCRLPGPGYLEFLERCQRAIRPELYLEIGVDYGASLRLALPPTRAVGVDPQPGDLPQFDALTSVFRVSSQEFFSKRMLEKAFPGCRVDLAFIDGSHLFEDVLDDFIGVEQHCHRGSVVLIHDCMPLDALTSARTRTTTFYTGDVWKILFCLRNTRPDLSLRIIKAPPSGVLAVHGLDPRSNVLSTCRERLVNRYRCLGFDYWQREKLPSALFVPNDEAHIDEVLSDFKP